MMEAEKVEPLGTPVRCTILVFSGCNRNPVGSRTAATSSRASSACSRVAHNAGGFLSARS
jgi:hypothetical protein